MHENAERQFPSLWTSLRTGTISTPPLNECIYCGRTDCDLSDEHALAFGLGGNWVLTAASCESCQRKIQPIEEAILGPTLSAFRSHFDVPTRKRLKDRSKSLPLSFVIDGREKRIEVPLHRHPLVVVLPVLSRPGLSGIRDIGEQQAKAVFPAKPEVFRAQLNDLMEYYGATDVSVHGNVSVEKFKIFLAKTAYAWAIHQSGIDSVDRTLGLLISSGDAEKLDAFVGRSDGPRPSTDEIHSLRFEANSAFPGLSVVQISLFTRFDFPKYHVVVSQL